MKTDEKERTGTAVANAACEPIISILTTSAPLVAHQARGEPTQARSELRSRRNRKEAQLAAQGEAPPTKPRVQIESAKMQFQQPSTQQFAQSGSASGLAPTSQTGQGVPWSTAHQIPAGSMQLQGMVPPQEAIQRPYDQMENLVQPRRPPWIQPPNTQTMVRQLHCV